MLACWSGLFGIVETMRKRYARYGRIPAGHLNLQAKGVRERAVQTHAMPTCPLTDTVRVAARYAVSQHGTALCIGERALGVCEMAHQDGS